MHNILSMVHVSTSSISSAFLHLFREDRVNFFIDCTLLLSINSNSIVHIKSPCIAWLAVFMVAMPVVPALFHTSSSQLYYCPAACPCQASQTHDVTLSSCPCPMEAQCPCVTCPVCWSRDRCLVHVTPVCFAWWCWHWLLATSHNSCDMRRHCESWPG